MKKLLPLAAALLLAACGAAPSGSSAVPAQETVSVTVDYSAYCDEVWGWLFRLEPDLYADPDCEQQVEIISTSYDGSTGPMNWRCRRGPPTCMWRLRRC